MAQNTCTPANIFSPVEHTLFLGCSITQVSVSLGWNEQASQFTVTLVEDTCSGTKRYYDHLGNSLIWTGADPGFMEPAVGSPAYFRIKEFEYCGLIQSWNKANSTSGKNIYTVTMTDPREILQGAHVIVGNYNGSVYNTYNLFNAFGYMEQYGQACNEIEFGEMTWGSPVGGFGGAETNDGGMQFNRVRTALSLLTSSFPKHISNFSPYGRLLFVGSSNYGMGLLRYDSFDVSIPISFENHSGYLCEYFLDLSELPTTPDSYRIPGTSITVLEMISQVCQESGLDYYIELVPVILANKVCKFIKIRTVSRSAQPVLGQIESFVGDATGVKENSIGVELRNETMSSFLFGGPVQGIYEAEQDAAGGQDLTDDRIQHFIGTKPSSDGIHRDAIMLTPSTGTGSEMLNKDWGFTFRADITGLKGQLSTANAAALGTSSLRITEFELQAAKGGFDAWASLINGMGSDSDIGTRFPAIPGSLDLLLGQIANGQAANGLRQADNVNLKVDARRAHDDVDQRDWETIFQFFVNFASNYGQRFMVRLPYVCGKIDDESGDLVVTHEIADGGWTENTSVIGLSHPTAASDLFGLPDGRLKAFVRFDNADLTTFLHLNQSDYYYNSGTNQLWIRADIDSDIQYYDRTNISGPRAVITLPAPVSYFNEGEDGNLLRQVRLIAAAKRKLGVGFDNDKINSIMENVGGDAGSLGLEYEYRVPDAAAIPIKDNTRTYGPWVVRGPAGQVKIDQSTDLVPWEFGSVANMDAVGEIRVSDSVTFMQAVENGSITIPGYPTIPLGAELGAVAGGFYGGGSQLLENRSTLSNGFSETSTSNGSTSIDYHSVNFGGWTGLYGPNITNIDIQMGIDGVTTTYRMQTYTPKFGKFNKSNADRLKKYGQVQNKFNKDIRKILDEQKRSVLGNQAIAVAAKNTDDINRNQPGIGKGQTPSEILIGQELDWYNTNFTNTTEFTRSPVILEKVHELRWEMQNYERKAYMSLDGLLRPVAMNPNNAYLPGYVSYYQSSPNSNGAFPPVYTGTNYLQAINSPSYYKLDISQRYLNPFTNPSGKAYSEKHASSSGSGIGHDIELIGRSTNIPSGTGSMLLPIDSLAHSGTPNHQYADDYRMMALRGPLLMQGWGYDIDGKPIPNYADNEEDASIGAFVSDELHDTFLDGWLRKSHTWPVAPVDLRFDRKRGVWTSPQPYKFLVGTVQTTGVFPTASGFMANPLGYGRTYPENYIGVTVDLEATNDDSQRCTNSGVSIDNKAYVVVDTEDIPVAAVSGDRVLLYYDVGADKYRLLHQGRKTSETIKFRLTQDMHADNTTGYVSGVIINGGPEIFLRNPYGIFQAFSGAIGYAKRFGSTSVEVVDGGGGGFLTKHVYEILEVQQPAEGIKFSITSGFNGSVADSSGEVSIVKWYRGIEPTGAKVNNKYYVYDVLGVVPTGVAASGMIGLATWNNRERKYYVTETPGSLNVTGTSWGACEGVGTTPGNTGISLVASTLAFNTGAFSVTSSGLTASINARNIQRLTVVTGFEIIDSSARPLYATLEFLAGSCILATGYSLPGGSGFGMYATE